MPNPRRSSACDCTCVLTRIDHCLVNNSIMTFALELIWHAFRYQFIRSIQNRNDKLQVQQLYTAGIPLLEAYLLPMANNRTRKERLSQEQNGRWPRSPDSYAEIHTRARFPRSKKWPTYHVAVHTRKRSSFATKHFQRKSLKIFAFICR